MSLRSLPAKKAAAAACAAAASGFAAAPSSANCDAQQTDVTQVVDSSLEQSWENITWLGPPKTPQTISNALTSLHTSPDSVLDSGYSVSATGTPLQSQGDVGTYSGSMWVSLAPPSEAEIKEASAVVGSWLSQGTPSISASASGDSSPSSPCEVQQSIEYADQAMQLASRVVGFPIRGPGQGTPNGGSGLSQSLSALDSRNATLAMRDSEFRSMASQVLADNSKEFSNLVQDMWDPFLSNPNVTAILNRQAGINSTGSSPSVTRVGAEGCCQPDCCCKAHQGACVEEVEVGQVEVVELQCMDEQVQIEQTEPVEEEKSAEVPKEEPRKEEKARKKGMWGKRAGRQGEMPGRFPEEGTGWWGGSSQKQEEGFWESARVLLSVVVMVIAVVLMGRFRR